MHDLFASRAVRHLALPQIGLAGHKRITASTALLIGMGDTGCVAARYLVSSGVGHLILGDFDTVEVSNPSAGFCTGRKRSKRLNS